MPAIVPILTITMVIGGLYLLFLSRKRRKSLAIAAAAASFVHVAEAETGVEQPAPPDRTAEPL
jgi:hypothetical protein